MQEIPDTITKPFVFCWISDFTWLKASSFSWIFEAVELGMNQEVFSKILVHKNSNTIEMPCGKVTVSQISSFWWISKPRQHHACSKVPVFAEMVISDVPCGKVLFLLISWSWFTERATVVLLFCRFLQVWKILPTLWCHHWHHSCNNPVPSMFTYTINCSYTKLQMVWKH